MRAHAACVFTKSSSLNVTISPHTHLFFARTHQTNTHTVSNSTAGDCQTVKSHTHTTGDALRQLPLPSPVLPPSKEALETGMACAASGACARARIFFQCTHGIPRSVRGGHGALHACHSDVCFSPRSCEMRGFANFAWLGHDIKHTHHAHVREMHVIDRHHAWADRSRSFGFPQPRFGFGP